MSFILSVASVGAADFFWIGGTGSWTDAALHWATTSDGATLSPNLLRGPSSQLLAEDLGVVPDVYGKAAVKKEMFD